MRLLILSDSPLFNTGYANITRHFACALPSDIEVAFGSLQHLPGLTYVRFNGREFRQYGCNPPAKISDAVGDFRPDLVLHVRDVLAHIRRWYPGAYELRSVCQGSLIWGWVPAQHLIIPWEFVNTCMNEYDRTLVFTSAGVKAFMNAGHMSNTIDHLPPGVSDAYSSPDGPIADVGRKGVPVVVSVGVHDSPRKMFPVLMRAYSKIVGRVDLDFYLHTYYAGAYDLLEHINQNGVQGHWMFPFSYFKEIGVPESEMARIYRRSSAYVSVGSGEGANLPQMEAAAMGRMIIYPDFPNNREMAEGLPPALNRPIRTYEMPAQNMAWESLMDVDELAEALSDIPAVITNAAAGRAYYEAHSWQKTAVGFLSLLKREGLY